MRDVRVRVPVKPHTIQKEAKFHANPGDRSLASLGIFFTGPGPLLLGERAEEKPDAKGVLRKELLLEKVSMAWACPCSATDMMHHVMPSSLHTYRGLKPVVGRLHKHEEFPVFLVSKGNCNQPRLKSSDVHPTLSGEQAYRKVAERQRTLYVSQRVCSRSTPYVPRDNNISPHPNYAHAVSQLCVATSLLHLVVGGAMARTKSAAKEKNRQATKLVGVSHTRVVTHVERMQTRTHDYSVPASCSKREQFTEG